MANKTLKEKKVSDANLDEEDDLVAELKMVCDKDGNEIDLSKSAAILHQLAKLYQNRKPKLVTHRMICLVKSAALFNAALARSPCNAQEIQNDLKKLCTELLHEADVKLKHADLVLQAKDVAKYIKIMRNKVKQKLRELREIPIEIEENLKTMLQAEKAKEVKELLKVIACDYKNIMIKVAKFTEKVMGEPPCSFSLAGMGSLAREEITPYSDFENMILMKIDYGDYEHMLHYFRWFSVLFQIVLINLQETIIPSVFITSLNDENSKHGNWYRDNITTRGICFDGMMPHACKFPLGRQQLTKKKTWATELIKPVNEMLKYLNSEESLKNGYHLSTILTKTCHVYGNAEIFNDFEKGVQRLIEQEKQEAIQDSVAKQITEDLRNFATRQSLVNIKPTKQFNLKRVVYRSTTILISELGRLHKVRANSCFEILQELANQQQISKRAKQNLMYAVALACEARLKWYMKKKRQNDEIDSIDTFASLVGKKATLRYFQIAYALQCDISKRLKLKKLHLYSNPVLLNISWMCCLNDFSQLHAVSMAAKENSKITERYYDFDECLDTMEKHVALEGGKCSLQFNEPKQYLADAFESLGDFQQKLECFDDAVEFYQKSIGLLESIGLLHEDQQKFQEADLSSSKDVLRFRNIALIQFKVGQCLLKQETKIADAKVYFEKSLRISKQIAADGDADREVGNSLFEIGVCYTYVSKIDKAMLQFEKSMKVRQIISLDMETDPNIAATFFELGQCLTHKKKYREALEPLLAALLIEQNISHNANDHRVALTLHVIGICYFENNDLNVAKCCFERSLRIKENISVDQKTDPEIATFSYWIGRCLLDLKIPENAITFFRKACQIWEAGSHHDLPSAFHWIGRCLFDMDRPTEGKTYLENSIQLYESLPFTTANVLDRANSSYWIGRCLLELKRPAESKENFEEALKIYDQVPLNAKSDCDLGKFHYWIGRCLFDIEKFTEAKSFLGKALQIYKQLSENAEADSQAANSLYWIGCCLFHERKYEEGRVLFEKALEIQEKLVVNTTDAAKSSHWIGRCFFKLNKFDEAEVFFEKSFQTYEDVSSDVTNDRNLADLSYWIGCSALNKNLSKSSRCFEKSLQIYEITSGNAAFDCSVAKSSFWLGRCLFEMKKVEEGKICFETSLRIYNDLSNIGNLSTNLDLAHSNYWIGRCVYNLNRVVEASQHFAKACQLYLNLSLIESDRDMANSCYWIGRCLLDIKKNTKAKYFFNIALQIYKRWPENAEADCQVANSFYCIGRCLFGMSIYKASRVFFEKALKIQKKSLVNTNDAANSYYWVGRCCFEIDNIDEAEVFFEKCSQVYGETSIDVARDNDLADLAYWIGRCAFNKDLTKSKRSFEKSLNSYESTSVNVALDGDVADSSYWLGRCSIAMKNFDKSKIHLEKALYIHIQVLETQFGSSSTSLLTNRKIADSNYWIGYSLYNLKKTAEAIEHFEKACRIYQTFSCDAKTDRDVANSNYWIGRCLLDMNSSSKAQIAFETALKIQEKLSILFFDESIKLDIASSFFWIGRCLFDLQKHKKASFFLRKL